MKRNGTGGFWRLLSFLCRPNLPFMCFNWLVTVAAVVGTMVVLARSLTGPAVYALYAVSAASLAYSVYTAVRFAPGLRVRFLQAMRRRAFTRNLVGDYAFRTVVFSALSVILTLGFAVLNLVVAWMVRSKWYATLAAYYICLSLLRVGVFRGGHRAFHAAAGEPRKLLRLQLRIYRLCGVALCLLEIVMMAGVTLMVLQQKPVPHSEIMAIALAAYTFYKVILAICNLIKAQRRCDPLVQSIRNIGLADAAVALLSLQVSLEAVFSDGDGGLLWLNAVMGVFVCLLTLALGIGMIVRANRRLRDLAKQGDDYAGERREEI